MALVGPPCFFVQAEDGIRYLTVTGVQTCALPIYEREHEIEPAGEPGRGLDDRAEVLLLREPSHVEDVLRSPRGPRRGSEARGVDTVRDQVDLRGADARGHVGAELLRRHDHGIRRAQPERLDRAAQRAGCTGAREPAVPA